jgi:hypothetical protein
MLICGMHKQQRQQFHSRRLGSLLPGLRTLDPPLGPPSTGGEIFWRTCLQSHLETSPPTPHKSYLKFRYPRTTFENTPLVHPKAYAKFRNPYDKPFFDFIGILIFLLLRSLYKNFGILGQLLKIPPYPPKSVMVQG